MYCAGRTNYVSLCPDVICTEVQLPADSGLGIVLRSLGMGLPFLLNFCHHGRLLRCVRDMATVDTLIAARLSRLRHVARLRLHFVEDVKFMTITVETFQGQSSVHEPSLLDARGA
jgi:hypothetical protein